MLLLRLNLLAGESLKTKFMFDLLMNKSE